MRFSRAGSTQFSICPLKLAGWIARYMSKSIPTPLCTAVSADDSQSGGAGGEGSRFPGETLMKQLGPQQTNRTALPNANGATVQNGRAGAAASVAASGCGLGRARLSGPFKGW